MSKDADGKRTVDETIRKFGRIDVLVNNAGAAERVDITCENFIEVYDRIVNVNLRGVVYITHLAIPHLIKSKGNIINISSVAVVRVNTVSPGPVRTDIINHPTMGSVTWEKFAERTALKRVSDPVEIADLILFLASDKSRGITGSDFVSDNGMVITK
ncbi:unnamed protein product, partial [Iphiclides podalirius]